MTNISFINSFKKIKSKCKYFMHICVLWLASFHWKLPARVVFIFSFKTSVLVWCGLKQGYNELKTTNVSDPRLSLVENAHFQKWAFSACFKDENDLHINSATGFRTKSKDGMRKFLKTKIIVCSVIFMKSVYGHPATRYVK